MLLRRIRVHRNVIQGSVRFFSDEIATSSTTNALKQTGSPSQGDRANKRVAFPNHRVILKQNRSKLEIEQNKIALKVSPTMSK